MCVCKQAEFSRVHFNALHLASSKLNGYQVCDDVYTLISQQENYL